MFVCVCISVCECACVHTHTCPYVHRTDFFFPGLRTWAKLAEMWPLLTPASPATQGGRHRSHQASCRYWFQCLQPCDHKAKVSGPSRTEARRFLLWSVTTDCRTSCWHKPGLEGTMSVALGRPNPQPGNPLKGLSSQGKLIPVTLAHEKYAGMTLVGLLPRTYSISTHPVLSAGPSELSLLETLPKSV